MVLANDNEEVTMRWILLTMFFGCAGGHAADDDGRPRSGVRDAGTRDVLLAVVTADAASDGVVGWAAADAARLVPGAVSDVDASAVSPDAAARNDEGSPELALASDGAPVPDVALDPDAAPEPDAAAPEVAPECAPGDAIRCGAGVRACADDGWGPCEVDAVERHPYCPLAAPNCAVAWATDNRAVLVRLDAFETLGGEGIDRPEARGSLSVVWWLDGWPLHGRVEGARDSDGDGWADVVVPHGDIPEGWFPGRACPECPPGLPATFQLFVAEGEARGAEANWMALGDPGDERTHRFRYSGPDSLCRGREGISISYLGARGYVASGQVAAEAECAEPPGDAPCQPFSIHAFPAEGGDQAGEVEWWGLRGERMRRTEVLPHGGEMLSPLGACAGTVDLVDGLDLDRSFTTGDFARQALCRLPGGGVGASWDASCAD